MISSASWIFEIQRMMPFIHVLAKDDVMYNWFVTSSLLVSIVSGKCLFGRGILIPSDESSTHPPSLSHLSSFLALLTASQAKQ
jgi:hypothetical protein